MKIAFSLAAASLWLAASAAIAPASAQIGPRIRNDNPPVMDAMTERQARTACRREMRGARESRASIARKMQTCMDLRMRGVRTRDGD